MSQKNRTSVAEQAWKIVLQQADKSRVRKAKQDARNGAVKEVTMTESGFTATVKASGPERGSFQVFLPWLADYQKYSAKVSNWLANRPDWVAAHYAGEWENDFIAFAKENGLSVFPDESSWDKLQARTKCTCTDWQPLCSHALALLFKLLSLVDAHPLYVFCFVGLDVDELLREAHKESVRLSLEQQQLPVNDVQVESHNNWVKEQLDEHLEQMDIKAPIGRLVPQFHPEKKRRFTNQMA